MDSPGVGENLQDHLMTGVSFEVADGVVTGDALVRKEPGTLELAMQMYQEHRAGPLASGGLMSYAFTPILESAVEELDPGAREGLERAVEDLQRNAGPPTSASQRAAADYLARLLRTKSESTGALFALAKFKLGAYRVWLTLVALHCNIIRMAWLGSSIQTKLKLSLSITRSFVNASSSNSTESTSQDKGLLSSVWD